MIRKSTQINLTASLHLAARFITSVSAQDGLTISYLFLLLAVTTAITTTSMIIITAAATDTPMTIPKSVNNITV